MQSTCKWSVIICLEIFIGTNFRETGQNQGFKNFPISNFAFGKSETHGLASDTVKS